MLCSNKKCGGGGGNALCLLVVPSTVAPPRFPLLIWQSLSHRHCATWQTQPAFMSAVIESATLCGLVGDVWIEGGVCGHVCAVTCAICC